MIGNVTLVFEVKMRIKYPEEVTPDQYREYLESLLRSGTSTEESVSITSSIKEAGLST